MQSRVCEPSGFESEISHVLEGTLHDLGNLQASESGQTTYTSVLIEDMNSAIRELVTMREEVVSRRLRSEREFVERDKETFD